MTCPEITVGFAHYPETATGAEVTSIEKVIGKCTDHSVAVSQPSYLCKGDGSWIYNTGQCACMAGYEADEASQTCRACPVGRFKVSITVDLLIAITKMFEFNSIITPLRPTPLNNSVK